MIVKVCKRVTNTRGMVSYLMGPGKGQIHENQHTVAGTINYSDPNSTELRRQLTADLDLHSKMHPGVQIKGGNVYHVVLSLPAAEGQLPDATWNRIATDFMDQMGMTGQGGKATMWTAIRHGVSAEGNDHVHIVANLIRQDGTRVSLHNDMPRASKVVAALEAKYGLTGVAGRAVGGNQQAYNGHEVNKARRTGGEVERVQLERLVRTAAEASAGEAEFVRRLRADGIEVRAYRTSDEVTGYSVKLAGGDFAYAGGKLARDLSLPALRRRWEQTAAQQRSASNEWIKGRTGQPVAKYGAETRANTPPADKVHAELADLRRTIETAHTPAQIQEASRQLAGVLAAGARVDPALRRPAREISAWAPRSGSNRRFQVASVTIALVIAAQNPDRANQVMVKFIIDAAMELYRLHRMRAQSAYAATRTTDQKGIAMTESDGLDDTLEGVVTTTVIGTAAAVQQLAQLGQERLEEEAKAKQAQAKANRGGSGWDNTAPIQTVSSEEVQTGAMMTDEQDQTLRQIAARAGLEPDDLRLGDVQYRPRMSVQDASVLIDSLGSPKYGSSGSHQHVLAQIRAQKAAAGGVAVATAAPVTSAAQRYARPPQEQGPGVGKNMRRKV